MKRLWALLGVRGKQLLVSVVVIVAAVGVFGVVAEDRVEKNVVARIEDELWRGTAVANLTLSQSENVDDTADAVADALGARVSVIDKDGVLIGDSELEGAALTNAANHADRPEVIAARSTGKGVARRQSTTLAIDALYVARAAGDRVVRLSLPLNAVAQTVSTLRGFFFGAAALAVAVAVIAAALGSHLVSRRLRTLLAAARAIRRPGNEDARDDDEERDDDAVLARTFDGLAADLEATLGHLRDERDRFEGLMQAMGEGIVAVDDTSRVVLCNRAARDLLRLGDDVRGSVLAVKGVTDVDGDVELDVGSRTLHVLRRSTVNDGVVYVVHDVSEIRRLETLRRDFVANVSHELRTPCSVILANAETLLNGALDDGPRALKFVEAVHRNAERLSRLIADLLELSKIEAGKAVFTRVPVNLREAIDHVVDAVEPRAREKDQRVSVDVEDDALAVEGDPKALDQVLINLVDNAVKYTPAGGHVTVRALRRGGRAVLQVEDDGPGVENKHKERLFERFYRVDSGRSRDVGGTGLGLAIVKHLVEAMDGSVGVEDAHPHGTRFQVELPLFSLTAKDSAAKKHPASTGTSAQTT